MSKVCSPCWPHGDIERVFNDVYVVRGTNITFHRGYKIQHSRNMTVVRDADKLTLINTVRLNESGLRQLEKLGKVSNVMRIGAFHGRDDGFYLERYDAKFYAYNYSEAIPGRAVDHYLEDVLTPPMAGSRLLTLTKGTPSEGIIHLQREGSIVICCDSVKNWLSADEYFDQETARQCEAAGEFQTARISPIWLQATGVNLNDFRPLLELDFKHLISAHGDVIYDNANHLLSQAIASD